MSTQHRQSDGVSLFTSNGIVNYTPAGSRKVLNKPVVLRQVLVIGQQTAWYPPGASLLSLLIVGYRKCGKLNEGLPPAGQSPSDALARNKHQILVHTLRTILHRCMRRGLLAIDQFDFDFDWVLLCFESAVSECLFASHST